MGFGMALGGASAQGARQRLNVAAYPKLDAIVRAALPAWQARHPGVQVEVISREMNDHTRP